MNVKSNFHISKLEFALEATWKTQRVNRTRRVMRSFTLGRVSVVRRWKGRGSYRCCCMQFLRKFPKTRKNRARRKNLDAKNLQLAAFQDVNDGSLRKRGRQKITVVAQNHTTQEPQLSLAKSDLV